MKRNSYRQKYEEDGQTNLQGNPTCACPQNGGLSSKDDCSLQKTEELSRIDLSKFPVGTRVVRVSPYLTLDIPDSFFAALYDIIIHHHNEHLHKPDETARSRTVLRMPAIPAGNAQYNDYQ